MSKGPIFSNYEKWYESVYPNLSGFGLWARGGELNTLPVTEFYKRDFRVMFARLSTYFDTGYSFTHQILYQIAAKTEGVFPDLAYLPPKNDAKYFAKNNIGIQVPWFLGTQTKFGPEAFDLIGISNSIVQELINLVPFYQASGIPLLKSERLNRADLPLIILGGANALYSTLLWNEDPIVDGIFVGESDQDIKKILEIARDGKKQGHSKKIILQALESLPGFVQLENPKKSRKSFIKNLNQSEALEKAPVYYIDEQVGTSHLQISEGCPAFCSFCAESWDRKPYRERSSEILKEVALRLKAGMGLDKIDLYSFNFNMHEGFYKILWDLVPYFKNIGLKSQRFDLLAHDPQMMEFQHAIEKASITCGLEGISPRLRKYLHKNLENEDLHKSLEAIFRSKAREMKVFLIATGKEEKEDFDALGDFLEHLKAIKLRFQAGTRIMFSMTPLVRFPWTPMEFEDAYSVEHYRRILDQAAHKIKSAGFEFRESADLPEYWVSQILVRADRPEIFKSLQETIRETGFVYYRDVSAKFREVFEYKLIQNDCVPRKLMAGFTLEESKSKPWAIVETGVKREFLWEEIERARTFVELDYCLGKSWKESKCFHCGGCDTRYHVRDIVLSKQKRTYTLEQFKERVRHFRKQNFEVNFKVQINAKSRGLSRKMFATVLAQSLMEEDFRLTHFYQEFKGSLWGNKEESCWVEGVDWMTLSFQDPAQEIFKQLVNSSQFIFNLNKKLSDWGNINEINLEQSDRKNNGEFKKIFTGDLVLDSPYEFKPDGVLKHLGLKYTFKKSSDNSAEYEFTKDSLRKGILKQLKVFNLSKGCVVQILPGPKFELNYFVQNAFKLPDSSFWVRIAILASEEPQSFNKQNLIKFKSQSNLSQWNQVQL